jgi:putative flippase GtrA
MAPGRIWLRFSRFSAIGVLGSALQVLLFDLFIQGLHLSEVAAAPIAVEIVLLHNFFWHERFTWRDRRAAGRWQRVGRLWRFHAANGLVSLAGNTLLTYWLVEKLRWPALAAMVTAIAACALFNFVLADRCVYTGSCADDPGF